jgi:SNF2 family DNA or RNA helicase
LIPLSQLCRLEGTLKNPAVEFQAMDQIHRLGQHRPVKAIKLVIEDGIESCIIQLQEKKSAMVDATLSTDDSAMGRLTPEDLCFLFRVHFFYSFYVRFTLIVGY